MSEFKTEPSPVAPDVQAERGFVEAILHTMDALVIVFDREGRILFFNRACENISGYSAEEVRGNFIWEIFLAPEDILTVKDSFSNLAGGQFPERGENHWIAKDGRYHDISWSNTPLLDKDGSIKAVIATGIDVTSRKKVEEELRQTKADLEKRVEERTEEFRRAHRALLESEANLRSWVENARDYVVYRIAIDPADLHGGQVVMVSPSIQKVVGIRDPYRFDCWFENIHPDDLAVVEEANRLSWEHGTPYNQVVRVFHPEKAGWIWLNTISTPVFNDQGKLTHFNGLILDISEQKRAEADLEQAYQTMEKRVEGRTRELEQRRRIAEGLRDILSILNSNRTLAAVLDYIVGQASDLLGSRAAVMHHVNYATKFVEIEASFGLPEEILDIRGFPLYSSPRSDQAILDRKPFYISRMNAFPPQNEQSDSDELVTPEAKRWRSVTTRCYNAYLAVPLIVSGEVYGSLAFYYTDAREFSQEDIRLGVTLGDQVSLALENARLRSQAEQLAVIAERNRLARDLHDAVTQTLFSASLIAEVLPRLWERRPEEGRRRLEELRLLNRGALAEMRTLLLELRPSALLEAETGEIFHHLVDAFTGRTRIPVQFSRIGVEDMPAEIKGAFYRIAQEALNNIAKHARASQVVLTIASVDRPGAVREIELLIRDNGQGFNPDRITAEHLGLEIMKERAGDIGATLDIQTGIGQGTTITVVWKDVGGMI